MGRHAGRSRTRVVGRSLAERVHRGGAGGDPGGRVRFGVIGTGSRGQYHMRNLLSVPNAGITALCDNYAHNLDKASAIAPGAKRYDDYRPPAGGPAGRRGHHRRAAAPALPDGTRRLRGGEARALREGHGLHHGGVLRDVPEGPGFGQGLLRRAAAAVRPPSISGSWTPCARASWVRW